MKRLILIAFLFCPLFSLNAQSELDTLSWTEVFSGENLYVKNVFSEGEGFAVQDVYLNDELLLIPTNATAFEIDLIELNLVEGNEYTVKIVYKVREKHQPEFLN